MNKKDMAYWRQIAPNDLVHLSDRTAIGRSQRAGQGIAGVDYKVVSVEKIDEEDCLAEWILLKIESSYDERGELYLIAKIVDESVALAVAEPIRGAPITRQGFLDDEKFELFQGTKRTEYLPYFICNEYRWLIKLQGELQGTIKGTSQPVTIVEYFGRKIRNGEAQWKTDQSDGFDEVCVIERWPESHGDSSIAVLGTLRISSGEIDVVRSKI